MWRIEQFLFKLKRGISWFFFSFKQNGWQEDYELFETIEKVLLDTANYFENRENKDYVVGVNNKEDVADMRLAAKLIRMRMSEHYWEQYTESQKNPNYKESKNWVEDLFKDDGGENSYHLSSYKFDDSLAASEKDGRALRIAMKIIAEKGFHWWV